MAASEEPDELSKLVISTIKRKAQDELLSYTRQQGHRIPSSRRAFSGRPFERPAPHRRLKPRASDDVLTYDNACWFS